MILVTIQAPTVLLAARSRRHLKELPKKSGAHEGYSHPGAQQTPQGLNMDLRRFMMVLLLL